MSRRGVVIVVVVMLVLFIGTPLAVYLSGQYVFEAIGSDQAISYSGLLFASGLNRVFLPIQCLLLPLLAFILFIFGLYSLRHKRGKPLLFGVLAVVATFVGCQRIGLSGYWEYSVSDQDSLTVGADLYRLTLITEEDFDLPVVTSVLYRCANQGNMCTWIGAQFFSFNPPTELSVSQSRSLVSFNRPPIGQPFDALFSYVALPDLNPINSENVSELSEVASIYSWLAGELNWSADSSRIGLLNRDREDIFIPWVRPADRYVDQHIDRISEAAEISPGLHYAAWVRFGDYWNDHLNIFPVIYDIMGNRFLDSLSLQTPILTPESKLNFEVRFTPDERMLLVMAIQPYADDGSRPYAVKVLDIKGKEWGDEFDGRLYDSGLYGTFVVGQSVWAVAERFDAVVVRDLIDGTEVQVLNVPAIRSDGLVFSGDGSRLGIQSQDGGVTIWRWDETARQFVEEAYLPICECASPITFSPDNRLVAFWNSVLGLEIWDVEQGKVRLVLRYSDVQLWPGNRLAFSPDGRLLAGISGDGLVHFWGVESR